jgi:hypothetical protein
VKFKSKVDTVVIGGLIVTVKVFLIPADVSVSTKSFVEIVSDEYIIPSGVEFTATVSPVKSPVIPLGLYIFNVFMDDTGAFENVNVKGY